MINLMICWKAIGIISGIITIISSIIIAIYWIDSDSKYKRIISKIIASIWQIILVGVGIFVLIGLYCSIASELC